MKMAWDVIGTEFAGRHQKYEKFYGGASFVVKQNIFRFYDFDGAKCGYCISGMIHERQGALGSTTC